MHPITQRLSKLFQLLCDLGTFLLIAGLFIADNKQSLSLIAIVAVAGFYRLAVTLAHYSIRRPFWDELRELFSTTLMMAGMFIFISFAMDINIDPKQQLLAWLLILILLPTTRNLSRQVLRRYKVWFHPVIIVGMGENALEAVKALESESTLGYRVVKNIHPSQLEPTLSSKPNAMIAIALESSDEHLIPDLLNILISKSRDYLVVPSMRGLPLHGLVNLHTFKHEVLLLRANNQLKQLPSTFVKRLIDVLAALVLSILLMPILVFITLRLWHEDGPIFFWHERIGRNGKPFMCPKFRTMHPDAERHLEDLLSRCDQSRIEWEASQKLTNDPRVTTTGRLLRTSSLDELPQLWSVLKGEMSLVGPRPITAAEMSHYSSNRTYYEQVRPGITGLWQVSGRSDADYPTRVALDVWYVRNWSMWMDIVILLKTFKVVFNRDGAY